MRRTRLVLFLLLLAPRAASPQGDPLGPEFRVNTYTTDVQQGPSVARDDSGNFVVVWQRGDPIAAQMDVFGQRYASSGAPLGPEFRVNTYTTAFQGTAGVASDSSGDFVVTWMGGVPFSGDTEIFAQRYASSGIPLGPEFRVNTITTAGQGAPAIASDSAGNFIVLWNSPDGAGAGLFGQRYASTGTPVGTEFRVTTYTTSNQGAASVAYDAAGNFVVVWQSGGQDGDGDGVFGQRFASTGAPVGPEFRVNTYITYFQSFPSVAVSDSGAFIVVWKSYVQDGSNDGVFGQRYASSGAPLGPEFRVNTHTPDQQLDASVAADSAGNFVVVWSSLYQDGPPGPGGGGYGVYGQRYASTGAPSGPEFRVNTYTPGSQYVPSVAADPAGNFVVVWSGADPLAFDAEIFGQRYGQIVPVELMRFGVE